MSNTNKRITKDKYAMIGKRIRGEMRKRNLSRQDMLSLLYADKNLIKSENTISQKCSGKERHFDLDDIRILAKAWEVREEYLLCESEYKTCEDEIIAFFEGDVCSDKLLLSLLEKRGHSIKAPYVLNSYTLLGKTKEDIIIDGVTLTQIDYVHMVEDIYKHIDFILDNVKTYVERRNACMVFEYAKIVEKEDSLDDMLDIKET